jgi:hypothetical protein
MQMALDAVMMGTMNPNRASQVFGEKINLQTW